MSDARTRRRFTFREKVKNVPTPSIRTCFELLMEECDELRAENERLREEMLVEIGKIHALFGDDDELEPEPEPKKLARRQ